MKKRKILVSLLCTAALLGVSTTALTSCKKKENPDDPTNEVEKFTVTFDSKGGSAVAKKENITSGSKVAKPSDPTKDGSVFAGWYKDSNCTQAWNFESDTVTGNITLYAKWTANGDIPATKFTVTFDSKGGSDVAALTNVESGAKVSKPEDPTKTNFKFDGWYKDNNCTQAWNFESDTVTANVTLYAKWSPVEVVEAPKATLVYNNGADNGTLTAVEDSGKYYFDRPADPKKDYHDFDNWYLDEACKNAYNWDTEAVDGLTLYAKFVQAYDTVYPEFDFAEGVKLMGINTSTATEITVGRFTCAAGVKMSDANTLNTGGKTVSFELKGDGNSNGITLQGVWASSSKTGSVYITNTDTNEVVKQIDNLANKSVIDIALSNLPAGHYTFTSEGGASIKISALSLTEKLPQGPTSGLALDVSSVQNQYLAGRTFSTDGLVVYLAYENGRKDELAADKYTISQVDMTTAGKKTVTITYQHNATTTYTETFDIHVYAIEELVVYTHVLDNKRITHNAQTLFALNGEFNSNNIAVKAKCLLEKVNEADPQEYIEFVLTEGEYQLTPADLTTLGNKSVELVYKDDNTKTASYDIEVVDIPDYSNEGLVTAYVDPAHELGVGKYASDQDCFYVHTINQALQLFELSKASDDAIKGIVLKSKTTYHEKIEINMPNVTITTMDETTVDGLPTVDNYAVIEFDGINGQMDPSDTITYETSGSATFSIRSTATNFKAIAVKFNNYWNTAERYQESLSIYGNGMTQAVAVLVEADKAAFMNCHFSSYQDTLYAKNGRQYYYQCYIEGHTDYIFGDDATAVFNDCDIKTIGNGDENNGGYVVATKGKTAGDKELKYGYIFDNCDFIADEQTIDGTTSLGRAWATGMSMMVMNSRLDAHFSKEAYGDTSSPKNDRYGKLSKDPTAALILEYNNTGDGAIDPTSDTTYLNNTCTILQEGDEKVAEYISANKLNKFFGADNGSKQYDDVWMPFDAPMDAVINLVDQDGNAVQTIEGASYIGSTITKSMLESQVNKIEGKTILGYFSDQACTTAYDYNTVLGETNTIYVKLQAGVVTKTESFNASTTGYTGTESLRDNTYTGESFTIVAGGSGDTKASAVAMEATADDGSGLKFTRAFVPGGSGRTYTITATKDITVTVYFTVSNSDITKTTITTAYSKSGELTVGGVAVTSSGAKFNNVAYAHTLTIKAGESVELGTDATSNRLVLFGLVVEYAL